MPVKERIAACSPETTRTSCMRLSYTRVVVDVRRGRLLVKSFSIIVFSNEPSVGTIMKINGAAASNISRPRSRATVPRSTRVVVRVTSARLGLTWQIRLVTSSSTALRSANRALARFRLCVCDLWRTHDDVCAWSDRHASRTHLLISWNGHDGASDLTRLRISKSFISCLASARASSTWAASLAVSASVS